jgi:hypothetical protein
VSPRKPGRPRKGRRLLVGLSLRIDPQDRKALVKRFGGAQAAFDAMLARELRPTPIEPPVLV